jgi:NAD(P)-dependent dehydrogenase (short-subunit alcohol dehydrogenase family)
VVITGGSSGIGLAAAQQATARGARVSLLARDRARLAEAASSAAPRVGRRQPSYNLGPSMNLAARMRAKRKSLGMTEQQLADRLKVSQEMVAMIELGTKALPAALVPAVTQFVLSGDVPGERARRLGR